MIVQGTATRWCISNRCMPTLPSVPPFSLNWFSMLSPPDRQAQQQIHWFWRRCHLGPLDSLISKRGFHRRILLTWSNYMEKLNEEWVLIIIINKKLHTKTSRKAQVFWGFLTWIKLYTSFFCAYGAFIFFADHVTNITVIFTATGNPQSNVTNIAR